MKMKTTIASQKYEQENMDFERKPVAHQSFD